MTAAKAVRLSLRKCNLGNDPLGNLRIRVEKAVESGGFSQRIPNLDGEDKKTGKILSRQKLERNQLGPTLAVRGGYFFVRTGH